jgi:hypothetical protein
MPGLIALKPPSPANEPGPTPCVSGWTLPNGKNARPKIRRNCHSLRSQTPSRPSTSRGPTLIRPAPRPRKRSRPPKRCDDGKAMAERPEAAAGVC